jgi:hypothetical protein
MTREWNYQGLSDYVQFFDEAQKEAVLKSVTEHELIGAFMGTTEGRLILNNVVDQIRDYTMNIVSLSVDGSAKNNDEITQAALNIRVAYNFMYKIASIAMQGEKIVSQLKKKD